MMADEEKASSGYARERAGLDYDGAKLGTAINVQKSKITISSGDEARIKTTIDQIDKAIKDLDTKLNDPSTGSKADADKKAAMLDKAKQDSAAAQKTLADLLNDPLKDVREAVKASGDLKASAQTYLDAKSLLVAYFFNKDALATLPQNGALDIKEDPNAPPPKPFVTDAAAYAQALKDYEKKLDDAIIAVGDKADAEQRAKLASDAANAQKSTDEKALTDAKTNRQTNIIKIITSGATITNSNPPAPAGGGTNP